MERSLASLLQTALLAYYRMAVRTAITLVEDVLARVSRILSSALASPAASRIARRASNARVVVSRLRDALYLEETFDVLRWTDAAIRAVEVL